MLIQVFGWVGALLILIGYFLVSTEKLKPGSWQYHTINALGSIGVLLDAFVNQAWPAVGLNVVWLVIAGYGFFRAIHKLN